MTITTPDAAQHIPHHATSSSAIAAGLAERFAETAAARDLAGGTPKVERDLLRESGLLKLSIPIEYGGLGASWTETLGIVRQLARVDSSVAHVFAFHHLQLASVRLFGTPAQWEPWLRDTASQGWFWGNALNPLDKRTVATRVPGGREFSGRKSFCSGALDSDMLLASAVEDNADGKLIIAAIPTRRAGVTLFEDWDNMGQRQTDSGSALFERVAVAEGEILSNPGPLSSPHACLRPLLAQLIFVNVFLGIAEGAFAEARNYTRSQTRAWQASPAQQATEDPYILAHYGEFWVSLEATRKLADHAVARFDAAWNEGLALTEAGRGEVALAVATAKVSATRGGLDLTSRIFEVTGARATTAALRLDRYWRNLRVHTLHDPVDYKLRELGDWALNGKHPKPSFYS
ncbi:MAG: acyl-CoA dehydrogenase family protein [Proteobacteria bacterium]|nr:acyl-CoA dehydrogenase family protein [Pseudomonadota bacterium]MBS0554300.1 acyl-CoA dehydrogenase family protein [Pseudomonadota bacterium]